MMSDAVTIAPRDEHNETLEARVHPPDWENPTPDGRYDLVVLGAGTGGLVAAAGAAGLGARVAIVERGLMGGDCLNYGCVPSKALLRSSRVAATTRRAAEFGVRADEVEVDFPAIMERMRRLRAEIAAHDSAERFREIGVDVYLGDGRFVDRDALEVDGRSLRFRSAVVATGARPANPSVEGLDEVGYHTNETIFSLTDRPARLVVVGGGPIGCEMAQAFARFGAKVTLVETDDRILSRDDYDASAIVAAAMDADGVDFRMSSRLSRVSIAENGEKRCTVETPEGNEEIACDDLLVAVGRVPNVAGLGLENAGVRSCDAGIEVDDRLRTSNRSIYAVGDVASTRKFTHVADAQARIVVRNALFPGSWKADSLVVPWCTYTDPELAGTGITPASAAEAGVDLRTLTQPLMDVDRAVLDGETEGFARIYLKKGSDQIVGATIVAAHAGEMISEITLAINAGADLGKISDTIHPYPTQAEAIRKIGDARQKERLTPFVEKLISKWLAWRR